MSGAVHGDDCTFLGFEDLYDVELLKSWFDLNVRGRLRPDEKYDKEIMIPGRIVMWNENGITIKADPKHAETHERYCGSHEDSKGIGKPGKKLKFRYSW